MEGCQGGGPHVIETVELDADSYQRYQYAEKLLLLSETSTRILASLPDKAPTPSAPYAGSESVAHARTTLQNALDHYQVGQISQNGIGGVLNFDGQGVPTDGRSFGESHKQELSRVPSMASVQTQNTNQQQQGGMGAVSSNQGQGIQHSSSFGHGAIGGPGLAMQQQHAHQSHPLYPSQLNNTPAPIPVSPQHQDSHMSEASMASMYTGTQQQPASGEPPMLPPRSGTGAGMSDSMSTVDVMHDAMLSPTASSEPTVAETGVPISAGATGPGPAKGSLLGGREGSIGGTGNTSAGNPFSDPLKQSMTTSGTGTGATPSYVGGFKQEGTGGAFPSAEEEKRRMASGDSGSGNTATAMNQAQQGPPPQFETAEDEKRRLEREERDKLLGAGGASGMSQTGDGNMGFAAGPPPDYQ